LNLVPQTHKKGVLLIHRHNFGEGGGYKVEKGQIKITGVRVGERGVGIARTGSKQTPPSFQIECFVKMQILMAKFARARTHTHTHTHRQMLLAK